MSGWVRSKDQENPVFIEAGVKPRKLIGPKGRAAQNREPLGFGRNTARFAENDYYQTYGNDAKMVVPYIATPSESPTLYHVVEASRVRRQLGSGDSRFKSQPGDRFSIRGSASFASAPTEKKLPAAFRGERAWFGSTQVPFEEHESRLRELQGMKLKKEYILPGPFESNLYEPIMKSKKTKFKTYAPVKTPVYKLDESHEDPLRTLRKTSDGHTFSQVKKNPDLDIQLLKPRREWTPDPGDYDPGQHKQWKAKDRQPRLHKSSGGPVGQTESQLGQSTHLAVQRNNCSPVPKVRTPSISYAMQRGHDWRALLEMQQRPASTPAYIGPHELNHKLSSHYRPSVRQENHREVMVDTLISKLSRSLTPPPPGPLAPSPEFDRPDSVASAYGRLQTQSVPPPRGPHLPVTPEQRYNDPRSSSVPPQSAPAGILGNYAGPYQSSLGNQFQYTRKRYNEQGLGVAGAGYADGNAINEGAEGGHMYQQGKEEDDDEEDEFMAPENMFRPRTPQEFLGSSLAGGASGSSSRPITPEMEVRMEEAMDASAAVAETEQRQMEWRLRNLIGPS